MTRNLYFFAVFLLASLLVYAETRAPAPSMVGASAPDFVLANEAGEEVRLSDYRGKLVFLNFWSTWCPGCVDEMPEMAALNALMAGRKFQMLAVSVDTSWDPVVDFYANSDIDIPTLLDPGQHTRNEYGVFRFPETFLIDPQGTVVRKYLGWRNWTSPDILAEIEGYLESFDSRL